jgi:hypothetical protein
LPARRTADYIRIRIRHPVHRRQHRHRPGHRASPTTASNQEFLRFLRQVARADPDGELHLVTVNYAAA